MSVSKDVIRKVLVIYIYLDKSGSMLRNGKIVSLNEGIPAACKALLDRQDELDVEIKIQIIPFSDSPKLMFDKPIDLEDFSFKSLTAGGGTRVGLALDKGVSTMTRADAFRDEEETGFVAPVVIIASDGQPTDNYQEALARAKQNKWWNVAQKIALAVGDDADKAVLAEVVGGEDKVISITDVSKLKELITAATLSTAFMAEQTIMSADAKSSASAGEIKDRLNLNEEQDHQHTEVVPEQPSRSAANTEKESNSWAFESNREWN